MLAAILSLLMMQGAALSGATHTDPVPTEVASALAAILAPGGVRAAANGTTITFWWVKDLPGQSWTDVPEGTLIGAVKLDAAVPDIRGHMMKAGVYTLRYGIQPANSDHFGVSPFRNFLLLSPAAVDTDPAAAGHDGAIALSKQTLGGSHPAVLSIDPPAATQAPLDVYTTQLGHKALIVQVGQLKFGIVLIGRIIT
ncbi:MAG TPA: hypothetical protein VL484_20460 [Vicinamibacterales bacterium]|jgi:hypothetical protein|nr:hypothetical protein [Vicinamibacterales bacterium]